MKKIAIFLIIFYLVIQNAFYNSFIDEADWINAGSAFKNAILFLNPEGTYIGYISLHPGVTVLWISSTIQLITSNFSYPQLVIFHRLVFLTIGCLLALIAINLLSKFFSKTTLSIAFLYFLLEPRSLISGRLTWLDFLLNFFILLCLLSWIRFLNIRNNKDIIKTGILLGLAVLTKFVGLYLYLILLAITLFYSKINRTSLTGFIRPLITVFLLSLFTFFILYPAMWVNPGRTLFSRFDRDEAGHELTLTRSASILNILPEKLPDVDPIILLGIPLVIYGLCFGKKSANFPLLIGFGGLIYTLSLTATLLILVDKGRGDNAFLTGFGRYLLPAIIPLGLFVFKKLLHSNSISYALRITLIIILFCGKLALTLLF